LADIGSLREVIFSQTERQLVELAVTIARQVIARELETDPSVLVELAREGIRSLDERDKIVVRFGASLEDAQRDAFTEALRKDAPRCEVIVDPALGPRECIVETELGRVDESIETRLYHVLEALVP
jgi:flagellar assembly protein FliH